MKFKTIKAFEEFFYFDEEEFKPEVNNNDTEAQELPGDLPSNSDCDTCEHDDDDDNFFTSTEEEEEEEEEDEYKPWGDERIRLEKFSTFNEKKKPEFWKKKEDKKDSKKDDSKKDGFVKPKKGEIPAALAAYQKKKNK